MSQKNENPRVHEKRDLRSRSRFSLFHNIIGFRKSREYNKWLTVHFVDLTITSNSINIKHYVAMDKRKNGLDNK